ncbi:MAG: DNA-binding protein [Lachnospiraceae bacterium]|nr:DNA-binding protein [Lachnospiraceae bacterium]
MEKIVKQSLLYDFYGELLTKHQRQIYEDAVFNDMSLSEIADNYDITRQAAFDLIKRCDKALESYECKLGMLERFDKIKSYTAGILKVSEELKKKSFDNSKEAEEISDLAENILDVL